MLSLVSCLDCTAVCVFFPSESFARLLRVFATAFISPTPCRHSCLLTSLLSTCFSLFLFICSPSVGFWAYVVFPSLRQCFSSCQTFSVSPFILFSLFLASLLVYAYMCMWACVHELSWLFSCVCPPTQRCVHVGQNCAAKKPFTIRGVKYFSIKKYISVLRSLRILTADIEKKL